MSDNARRLRYDPRTGPDRVAWLGAPEAERTLAIREWLKRNDLPFPCCVPRSADEWREVEDQLASGTPPETARLLERMLGAGIERIVAVWAMAEAVGSQRYKQLQRMASNSDDAQSVDIGRLFEGCDTSLLPAAFEASAGGFGPAHAQIIDYYHHHYDPEGSLPFASAAGFCFGCATAPKFVRNHTLYEFMYGNEITDETPVYLPVSDAYRELFRYVSDAVFEQDDPIPPSVRPPEDPEACFDSPFSGWCSGFIATRPVVAAGWESHLAGQPGLHAEYLAIVDTLSFFAGREQAQAICNSRFEHESFESACHRVHAELKNSIQRLFLLAHPVMDNENNGGGR